MYLHILIFARADGTIFGENDSPGILKCYVPQEFVIEWGAGKAVYSINSNQTTCNLVAITFESVLLAGGLSIVGPGGFFASWSDPNSESVEFLSFGTDYVRGYWFIARSAG